MWIDVTKEEPKDGDVIDVWQGMFDEDTGKKTGRRLTNAWVHQGRILHGKNCEVVRYFTHWMPVPAAPDNFYT